MNEAGHRADRGNPAAHRGGLCNPRQHPGLWLGGQAHPVPPEPIGRLAGRIRRLRAELEALETRSDVPAKGIRLRALRGAYTDLLRVACERLEASPPPDVDPVPQAEIYRVEAALRERGLDVRETATH